MGPRGLTISHPRSFFLNIFIHKKAKPHANPNPPWLRWVNKSDKSQVTNLQPWGGSWSSPGSRQRSEEATDAACLKTAGKRSKRPKMAAFIAPHPSRREEASSISDHVEDPALFQNPPPPPPLPVINERNRIKAEVKTGEVWRPRPPRLM